MEEKSKSQQSIGFGVTDETETQRTTPGPVPYDQCLYNICVFGIKCQHKKMPLFIIKEKTSLWLPYVYISPGQKWITSNVLIEDIIAREQIPNEDQRLGVPKGSIESMQLVAITRIQLPSEEFVNQMVFSGKWKSDSKIVCCKDTNSVVWLSINNIIEHKVPNVWGKDVIDFAEILVKRDEELRKSFIRTVEIQNSETYRFLTYNNSSKSENNECKLIFELINETGVKREVMERLYSDFFQHCFPSIYMSFISFKQYINRMDLKPIDDSIINRAFKAMKFKREVKDCLTFDEFLLGLIALEPKGPQNRLRDAYIFRYYDSNDDGVLDRSDIKNMVKDIKALQNKQTSITTDEAIEEEVDKIFNISDISDEENRITFDKFLSKVKSPELKPISILFRASESLHKLISDKNIYQKIEKTSKVVNKEEAKNCCPKHRLKNFKIAIHKLSVTSEGRLTDPKNVGNTDGKDIHFAIECPFIESQRSHSIEVVNKYRSIPNFVMDSIRELAKFLLKTEISHQSKRDFKISTSEKLNIHIIEQICKAMEQIFQNENRVLKVQSPAFVLGDIHGNLKDLIQYEDQLWRTAPQSLPTSIVFAGDYVDRGDYSVECVLYLYSLKLLCPNHVFLLRGNHEIRSVQRNFTFEKECISKYYIKTLFSCL